MNCLLSSCATSTTMITVILLSLLCLCVTSADAADRQAWPDHYTDAHQELHRLLRSTTHSHLEDFEVVVPTMVDHHANHVSHRVRHVRRSRMRSNVVDDVIVAEETGLRYKVSGFGQDFHMHLEPNTRLLAPTFTVKRMKRDAGEERATLREEKHPAEKMGCHYHGHLTSHKDGVAAVSTCDGLTGLLRTESDDYLLEPTPAHVNHSFPTPHHPHVIYKRRHLDNGKHRLHYCGKKRHYPVTIPDSEEPKKLKLLSNGEIELEADAFDEDAHMAVSSRRRRSADHALRSAGNHFNDVSSRLTASNSRPGDRNVETLVVADRDMIRNHERDHRDVTTYVLTVMNMVTGLYSDRTLDGQVNVVLVGVMLLEDNNEDLELKHKADESLSSFCRWQSNLNYTDDRRPDHSILLTGIDICVNKNSPCETLGLAQVGGMCSYRDSCTINEDMGLGLAFTVAHETGHSFGMKHDGQSNLCSKRDGHIMSPTLNGLNGVFTWSTCSREALSSFLRNPVSTCLDDHPAPISNINLPSQLPGEIYDASSQCKWQFGTDAGLCAYRYKHKQSTMCKILWCQRSGSTVCETKYMPAAEGTPCGQDKWCRRGVCVPYGSSGPEAIDGSWGEFGHWSSCTRTCGAGVQFRKRACDSPRPQFGGRHCDGDDKIYQMCNSHECPPSQISFRAMQCAEFNHKPYRRQYFTWVPFAKYSNYGGGKCELLCKAEGYDFFDMLADKVTDGTPCDSSSSDVCIEGKCRHVGCDFVLGSNATHDACGICNGDNSTCQTVNGSYDEDVKDSGYYEVVTIPRGARSVQIQEDRCCTHSYITVRSASNRDSYYLNGDWRIDLSGENAFAGSTWKYERKAFKPETLTTRGPLTEDVMIEILVVARNPGISYSYTLPIMDNRIPDLRHAAPPPPRHTYEWSVSYGECSKTCAGGTQAPQVTCMQDGTTLVDDDLCGQTARPSAVNRACNTESCPARWYATEWGGCTRTCGGGVQTRRVACKMLTSSGDIYTSESRCDAAQQPPRAQSCQQVECPAMWHTGVWSKCSRECGRGVRTRSVRCRSGFRTLRHSKCDRKTRPKSKTRCLISYCQRKYQWFITGWTQCSATCGSGVQQRELKCSYKARNGQYRTVSSRRCKRSRRPAVSLQKVCSLSSCPALEESPSVSTQSVASRISPNQQHRRSGGSHSRNSARWITGTWQKCSVSCGGGLQTRAVRCLQAGQPSNACAYHQRPVNKRSCNTYQCSVPKTSATTEDCKNNFKWCYLVPQHGQCNHRYFGKQCCKACKASAAP